MAPRFFSITENSFAHGKKSKLHLCYFFPWIRLIPSLSEGSGIQLEQCAITDGKFDISPNFCPHLWSFSLAQSKSGVVQPEKVEVAYNLRMKPFHYLELAIEITGD